MSHISCFMSHNTTYSRGLFAEFLARAYLRLHGFRIVRSRYITGRNTHRAEIDIIACRGNLLVFVEVKNRPNIHIACDAVTAPQAARLRRAAETYIMKTGWGGNARFDIIAVCGFRIHWIKNAI